MLGMQELKLQKNAVWTLIALNCWEKLSQFLFQRITVWSLDLTLVDRLIQLNICSLDMNFETKWAKFQRFKQRYFLNSLALSERLLLVSYISASTITPLTKMQQQLASAAAVIKTKFTRLIFTLDVWHAKVKLLKNRCLHFDWS